jgi:peptidyl-prolyl cis-trans isomerase SurA
MRRFVLMAISLLAGGGLHAEILDGVAAIVNDKIVTYSDVRSIVQPVVAQLRRNYSGPELVLMVKAAQQDALNTLIEHALILQEFKTKGYSFPDTVVDEQFNDIIANDFSGDRAAFIKTLQAENMTVTQYREQLRDRTIVQAMRNRKTQNEVVVSPYKIESYYREHLADFKVEDQVKLRMIVIKKTAAPPPIVPEAVSTNATGSSAEAAAKVDTNAPAAPPVDPRRRLAEEILAKLDAGESFESLASRYSDGKEAQDGGDWGWIGRDVLRKELSDVAFGLKAGQHGGIIDTPEGYYLLHIEAVKPAHSKPLSEVRDEIEKTLLIQQRTKMQQAWVQQLRSKAYIRVF